MNLNLTPSLKSVGTEPAPRSVPLAKRGDEFRTPSLRFPLQAGGTKTLRFPSRSGGNLTEGGKQVQTPSYRFPLQAGGTKEIGSPREAGGTLRRGETGADPLL